MWVAELDGRVVALAGLVLDGDRGELEPVVVERAARGSGVGRALVEHVVGDAVRRGVVQLRVRPVARNAEAFRFFGRHGFDVVGRVELILDRTERATGDWRPGVSLAGLDFRV
jgi:N-acetylglutamate synthase-like GNAT family acetyltransferase